MIYSRSIFLITLFSLVFSSAVFAATDGVQVDLSVTRPTGGGGGDPPTTVVSGCTDPLATNYNSSATVDNGSCTYPPVGVPNASNFSGNYSSSQARVNLTWQNPSYAEFSAVRVVRSTSGFPAGPNDGLLIYDGSGQATTDTGVSAGQTYFYTAFVRSISGEYSSGAVTAVTVPTIETPAPDDELPPPDDEPSPDGEPPSPPGDGGPGGEDTPPGDDGTPGGGGETPPPDPFQIFPEVVDQDPIVLSLDLGDFVFFQPGERQKFFRSGENVSIVAGKDVSIMIDYDRLPEALKTIGLTIVDPENPKRSSSFILRINKDKTAYTANIGSLFKAGTYPIYISIINFKNQTIKRLVGKLIVGSGLSPARSLAGTVGRITSPVITVVGLGTGLAQALSLTSQINSFSDFYFLIIHFWSILLRGLGLRKRLKPWGVVYDSVTKRPLDPAYVIIKKDDQDVTTAITDLDGRYGFFLPAGAYTIVANKTHYRFPSEKLAGRTSDELYENIYFGEPFPLASGEVVNQNIPLDPIAFDWNEFAKEQQGFFILHSRREGRRNFIYNTLFVGGLVLSIYNLVFKPSLINLIVPVFYLGILSLKYFWAVHRPAVAVKRAITGLPVPFAVIRAFIPSVNQEVKTVVADAMGRFFLLTPPGEYYITVEEKLPDESYKKIYQSEPMKLDKGVLPKDLLV